MELNITEFWKALSTDFAPSDFSASRMEKGDNAGSITWSAAVEESSDWMLLDSPEKIEEMRAHIRSMGAWSDEEIAAMSDVDLNAMLIQCICGDIRETPDMSGPDDWDWALYQEMCDEGVCSGRLFGGSLAVDGVSVYYTIGD
jgi:hypothetical protein